jgi:ribonuclease HI
MIVIYSDGGARGNPGPAASAYAIYKDEELIKKDSKYLGKTTNNVAEYSGVIEGLKGFLDGRFTNRSYSDEIIFKMDSELVVKQLTGVYKIKDKKLMELSLEVRKLIRDNNLKINFVHVPRALNKLADKLVNEKLDESSRL